MKKHKNIPIFIPHLGCPNNCVFCNQRKISGITSFDINSVRRDIDLYLETSGDSTASIQLAYFGGSFTAIERDDMLTLLRLGYSYIAKGKIESMRISTRPDCIDSEILACLRDYGVKSIELGIQSLYDDVLSASGRGHTARQALNAMNLVNSFNCFELVGQMMTALPESTPEKEAATARMICEHGAHAARIYPTMVFAKTELENMLKRGDYILPTVESLVSRTAKVFAVFQNYGVKVIRIGLAENESLHDPDGIVGDCYHPAMGELVMSEYYKELILKKLENNTKESVTILCAKGETSKVIGHKGANKKYLQNKCNVKNVKVIEKNALKLYNIEIM